MVGVGEIEGSSGYGKPPWIFKGSALYQLHLVKAETARACIPKQFRLVEAFGYTLGGFFLASYDDSPAGMFDELVVIAGLAWNPPTSCAWAAKVLVNSDEACDHGRKEVGLPSQVAKFSKRMTTISRQTKKKSAKFLNMSGIGATFCSPMMDVQATEINVTETEIQCTDATGVCNINLKADVPANNFEQWMGPAIRLSLPSFSGCTECNPNLLRYSCEIECRVRAVKPVKVLGSYLTRKEDMEQSSKEHGSHIKIGSDGELEDDIKKLSMCVMLSKPILALKFSHMKMKVGAPTVYSRSSNTTGVSVNEAQE